MQKLKGFRTILFNAVMGLVAVLNAFGLFGTDAAPSADQVTAAFDGLDVALAAIWSIGNVILRAITNTPMFKKSTT